MEVKKRFIAGAVCPRCLAMDTIVKYRVGELDYRECVVCGFADESRFAPQLRELQTRVNTSADEVKQEMQVVKIMDAPQKHE
jgi:uncharacterized protein